MLKRSLNWISSHRKLSATFVLGACVIILNFVAFMHAWAMTHFVRAGAKTANPEALSALQKAAVLVSGITVPKPVNNQTPRDFGLEFDVHRFDGDGGIELEAWHASHDSPRGLVLMFHGYAASKSVLLREASAFHKLAWSVFLVDFRGSGGSSEWTTSVGIYEADDVARTWSYVCERWPDQRAIMFGQSMGSAAVLRAVAARNVQPAALVLECPFDTLLSTTKNRFSAMSLPSFPFAQLLVFWGGTQQGFNGFRHNPAEYAKRVRSPVLLMHGECDTQVRLGEAKRVYDSFTGAKRFHVFAGLKHESYVTSDEQQWERVVGEFLDEIEK